MKRTIIVCDLCDAHIYKSGYLKSAEGAIMLHGRELDWVLEVLDNTMQVKAPKWFRRRYHICPNCVDKIKEMCRRKSSDKEAAGRP